MQLRKMLTVVTYTSLYTSPSLKSFKHCDLLDGTIVFYNNDDRVTNSDGVWSEVLYRTNAKEYIGWVLTQFIEPFIPSLLGYDIIKTGTATKSLDDFAQNIIYKGNVQFNLCGEFSVLYCAGHYDVDIIEWLDLWQTKSPSIFNRIFSGGRSRTTGIPDLTNMLHTFEDYPDKFQGLTERFQYGSKIIFTPYKAMDTLVNNRLIIGCKIEGRFGRLRATGIPHWVVLEKVTPEGRGGTVNIYNPASNSIETYDWDSFVASVTKNPFGLVVPR